MKFYYEKIWKKITNIFINEAKNIIKNDIRFRTDTGICYFIAELDFTTSDNVGDKIIVNLPEINIDFIPCENTIFSTKIINDEEIETLIRVKLEPEKLVLTSYPFTPNTYYEINIQLFMCMNDDRFIM